MIRLLIATISALVLYGLAPVIGAEISGTGQCPTLGPLPACYIVGLCYTLIAISTIGSLPYAAYAFWIGWLPVFSLALIGSTLELSGTPTCPRGSLNIPMCYFSLAIAALLLLLFKTLHRGKAAKHTQT